MKKDERTGAKALVESLAKAGTEILFGYPGGAVLDIYIHRSSINIFNVNNPMDYRLVKPGCIINDHIADLNIVRIEHRQD